MLRPDQINISEPLTEREKEILVALVDGLSNQEIANTLHIALPTVKWYNTQIYAKLGVQNRQEAVDAAQRLRLVAGQDSSNTTPRYLPRQATSFIGREDEIRDMIALLADPAVRMVTILAPGGMGKSRLALEVGEQILRHYENGVFFVALAPVLSADTIIGAIADSLGFGRLYQDDISPQDALLEFLEPRKLLLILDNFEHLLIGAPLITDLLRAAPALKVLVTSRERLNLQGETVYALGGMRLPVAAAPDKLARFDSMQLFLQSARRLRPDFEPDPAGWEAVVQICRMAGGMPLAIELAAGWVDMLELAQIMGELQRGIDILETEMRDVPERHRSIRATLNQSWDCLSTEEQSVLRHLSVFRGGFTAEAAAAVAGASIRILRRLMNKALLQYSSQGRYDMHELLRQYTEEKLLQAGQINPARHAHAVYFAEFMTRWWNPLGDLARASFEATDPEVDNLLAAWQHLVEAHDFETLEKLRPGLVWYMETRNDMFTILDQLRRTVDVMRSAIASPDQRYLLGCMLLSLGRLEANIDIAQTANLLESVQILEEFGPSNWLAVAYHAIGTCVYQFDVENHAEAIETTIQKGVRITESLNLEYLKPGAYSTLAGWRQFQGRLEEALELANNAIAVLPDNAHQSTMAFWVGEQIAQIYIGMGRIDEGITAFEALLPVAERAEYLYGIAHIRTMLCRYNLDRGQLNVARQHMAAVLVWHQRLGQEWQISGALIGAYGRHYLLPTRQFERAALICSFIFHYPFTTRAIRRFVETMLPEINQNLEDDIFKTAWESGKHKTLVQMMNEAVAELTS